MNQPPNNGDGFRYGSGEPYGPGPYGEDQQNHGGHGNSHDPYGAVGGGQDRYGVLGSGQDRYGFPGSSEGPYGASGSGQGPYGSEGQQASPGSAGGYPGPDAGQRYGSDQPQGGQYSASSPEHGYGSDQAQTTQYQDPRGAYAAAPASSGGAGGGISGFSPKMLGIIGGGIVLLLVILLVLVFVVFGDSEERDRRNAIKAAEKFVDTVTEGETFSEFNEQLCPRNQADERDVEEIDDEMAAMAYDIPELLYLSQDDIDDLREIAFTERDVEFTSDARREALVYFDANDEQLTFRNIDGDWLVCDYNFDMSDADVDDFYWN